MIKSNELRIGNYILVDNALRKVCSIKNDENDNQTCSIGFENNNSCEYENAVSERLAAVPISDEILINLGFTFHDYFKTWRHTKPERTFTVELNRDYSAVDFGRRELVKNVQYLHLLQNLFFSVQKEELRFTSLPADSL